MNTKTWQDKYLSGPFVWATFEDGQIANLYDTRAGAELEVAFMKHAHITVRKTYIHTEDLARQRWPTLEPGGAWL